MLFSRVVSDHVLYSVGYREGLSHAQRDIFQIDVDSIV